jgi:hypothetical protein
LSLKSDGLIEVLGIKEGGATLNLIAVSAKESTRHQQFCPLRREVGTMSLTKLLALRIHAGVIVSYDEVWHAFSSVIFSFLNCPVAMFHSIRVGRRINYCSPVCDMSPVPA